MQAAEINHSFFEPEVRNGFYVPSEMKQAWAAQLEVLKEIDRICKKHGILYFVDWGTLLGAVRHGGFIPWDDDIDITMKRADYQKFVQVVDEEMEEGFRFVNYEKDSYFWSCAARFVAKDIICFDDDHLKRFHGFPYASGIDIFVLDFIAKDSEDEEARDTLVKYVLQVVTQITDGTLTGKEKEYELETIEQVFSVALYDKEDLESLRIQLYRVAEKLLAQFSEEESEELTRLYPDYIYKGALRFAKQYYEKQVWLPFEYTVVPVPSGYDEMLRKRYGNYMRIVRTWDGHEYPYYQRQVRIFLEKAPEQFPQYLYTGIAARDAESGRKKSLKNIVQQSFGTLCRCMQLLEEDIHTGNLNASIDILEAAQQIAIQMGTLIDKCKGEGHPTVSLLEQYCEMLYQFSQEYTQEVLAKLQALVSEIQASIQKDILQRTTAVFLPYKAEQWEYMQSVWQAAIDDENCDVYVIPIPYYYKGFAKNLQDMEYEAEQFPEHVSITAFEDFDFQLQYPEKIFIQNPYDEFDPIFSVHSFFYSTNLIQFTEQLIYIPPFVLEEFTSNDYREYWNMKHYCNMPGVVNADKVIVQSENMKQLYVQKLTEFAGEDTKQIWENKIVAVASPKEDADKAVLGKKKNIPQKWRFLVEKPDGSQKKIILYYVGLSSFFQYKEKILDKIQEVFEVFSDYKDQVVILWKPHELIYTTLEQTDVDLYQQFCDIEQEYKQNLLGMWAEDETEEQLVGYCDAYYGDVSPLMEMCQEKGKVVMVQRVD